MFPRWLEHSLQQRRWPQSKSPMDFVVWLVDMDRKYRVVCGVKHDSSCNFASVQIRPAIMIARSFHIVSGSRTLGFAPLISNHTSVVSASVAKCAEQWFAKGNKPGRKWLDHRTNAAHIGPVNKISVEFTIFSG